MTVIASSEMDFSKSTNTREAAIFWQKHNLRFQSMRQRKIFPTVRIICRIVFWNMMIY